MSITSQEGEYYVGQTDLSPVARLMILVRESGAIAITSTLQETVHNMPKNIPYALYQRPEGDLSTASPSPIARTEADQTL
ncbi:MAG: hypothetical protein JWN26_825 [Candidatus Saccharibacteria bacterium]|nr:hypothetical protein [Candidatus Saccharibacteria bacterium]